MDPNLRDVFIAMRQLGCSALAHAMDLVCFTNSVAQFNSVEGRHLIAVLNAGHAAEILIKARIAQEHPLLVFKEVPKRPRSGTNILTFEQLLEDGRTLMFNELPERLWAVTGYELPNQEIYQAFGRLRNAIQHFASPNRDVAEDVIVFIFKVIAPLLWDSWRLLAIDHFEDPDGDEYILNRLSRVPVPIRVRESARRQVEEIRVLPGTRAEFIIVADAECASEDTLSPG